jgi:peptidoglycan/xylan/chitin deacetylase (PgdA/CDA1 family)
MNAATHLALKLHYGVTTPLRVRRFARLRRDRTLPICVLFYHRVADWCPNAWTIPTRVFQTQIQWLRENFNIVPLAEAQRRIDAGQNDRPIACLTFDDGYADNFDVALPLLIRDKIPFTYFVASQHVLKGQAFPHDVEAGYRLRPNKPAEIQLLARAGVDIGSHSQSHANLGLTASAAVLTQEIVESKHDLEDLTGREVRYFAFPYGLPEHMSPEAFRVAYEAGYRGVCSAYGAYNFPGGDSFHIRRIHGDKEIVRLKTWLMLDPRKLKKPENFDPGHYREPDLPEVDADEETAEHTLAGTLGGNAR